MKTETLEAIGAAGSRTTGGGAAALVLPWLSDSDKGWFCSEAMAAALKLKEPWRFGPNGLAAVLPRLFC